MTAAITKGHVGDLVYIPEATQGSEPSSGTLQIPSDSVANVSLTGLNNGKIVYTIGDFDGQDTVTGCSEYVLSFDYNLQQVNTTGEHLIADTIEYNAVTRTAGQPTTLTFYYTTTSGATYMLTGSMCNTLSKTCNVGEVITYHAEYWAETCAITNSHMSSLTDESAIANTYETFAGAAVTRPDGTAIACGVGNFSASINNNCTRVYNIGSADANVIQAGIEEVSGSIDILIDAGGTAEFAQMQNATENTISFETGSTASQSEDWEYTNAIFTNFPINYAAEDAYVVSGVSWIAEGVTLGAYSS